MTERIVVWPLSDEKQKSTEGFTVLIWESKKWGEEAELKVWKTLNKRMMKQIYGENVFSSSLP